MRIVSTSHDTQRGQVAFVAAHHMVSIYCASIRQWRAGRRQIELAAFLRATKSPACERTSGINIPQTHPGEGVREVRGSGSGREEGQGQRSRSRVNPQAADSAENAWRHFTATFIGEVPASHPSQVSHSSHHVAHARAGRCAEESEAFEGKPKAARDLRARRCRYETGRRAPL